MPMHLNHTILHASDQQRCSWGAPGPADGTTDLTCAKPKINSEIIEHPVRG